MFLEGAEALRGKEQVFAEDLHQFFAQGLGAVQIFGGAQPGDKTMIDALSPAVEAMEHHKDQGLVPMLRAAVLAAEAGVEKTKTLQAKRGRSRFVGERSIGHQDAGATSLWLMLKTFSETVENQGGK
jgi:dihydroxyacetone kinase